MKLDPGDHLVCVRTCTEDDDILLSARRGKVIRFPVSAVRVFSGRTSTGVRGIRLANDDEVISMSALHHVEVEVESRDVYLQAVNASRRLLAGNYTERAGDRKRDEELAGRLAEPMFANMQKTEEFILMIAEDGQGKRSSAFEYRISGRGGQGVTGIDLSRGEGLPTSSIVAAFTVLPSDHIVMVSDSGQIIRCPVEHIRVIGRSARGVTVFDVADGERLVSASRLRDVDGDEVGDELEDVSAVATSPEEQTVAEEEVSE